MILADTSVWIDYFNGAINRETELLDEALVKGKVAMGDLIYLEILQGFRRDKDYRIAKRRLASLTLLELFGSDCIERCAANYRNLRRKGITVRRTSDVIIASFCIHNRIPLLYRDKDFLPFRRHLGLREV